MSAVPATPLDGPLVQGIRRHLEGLKSTPDGAALYMMIERGLRRYGGEGQMEHAFLDFLHGMLARHAKDTNTDPATRVKARMIQQRLALALAPPTPPAKVAAERDSRSTPPPPTRQQKERQHEARQDVPVGNARPQVAERSDSPSPSTNDSDVRAPVSKRAPASAQDDATPVPSGTQTHAQQPAVTRPAETNHPPTPRFEEIVVPREASQPRPAPADEGAPARSSEKLGTLEETLVEKVTETITFNKEFDEIVKTEQTALERADRAIGDFKDLKQLLVRGLDELVRERDELKERLGTAAEFLKAVESDRRKLKGELGRLRKQALADELTGLPKREVFVKSLEAEISRVRRYGFALALAVLDVDGLERINTQYGREAGDAVLRSYANEILANFRTYDLVARYGEDEFAVLFPNTQKEGALRALEKAQKRASETYLSHDGRSFPIPTFSSVLTLYTPGEKPEQLLRRAEDALDHAKLKGHARMVVALPGA